MDRVKRMWVNQPSTSQAYHRWHGVRVLAVRHGVSTTVYFLEGPVVSMHCDTLALSEGWPASSRARSGE